jgi:phosphate transport system substrate-binding protein
MKSNIYFLIALVFLNYSCGPGDKKGYTDTPTSGDILIVADESYQPLVQIQIDTFMEIYKYARIRVKYLPESEVFSELLNNDSIRIAIVSRHLSEDEKSYLDGQKIIPRSLKVAEDAIALIVNRDNPDTAITYEQLQNIMRGKIATWTQLNTGGLKDSIRIVFDKNGSTNARYIHEHLLNGEKFPANSFATNSNASVVDYVSEHKGSLGVIGVNWISDQDDSLANAFLGKINVVALSMPDTGNTAMEFNKPYQAYIALKQYPLLREVIIINREGRNGLGTGFASFFAGDKGQRLIRLTGLLPATMPIRIINVN